MHVFTITAATTALFLLSTVNAEAGHAAMARRHMHVHSHKRAEIAKRSTCAFPIDAGLVAVTPGEKNAGWAMSPDQPCEPGMYCPYACPPGQLMAQWDPNAKVYAYPQSMNGGLYCNEDGEIEKPFPKKPYCYDGAGTVSCKNKAGGQVSVCQTVLPGNEAMLIPTLVDSISDLAVPDTSYWAKTAAHFYINPPGVNPEEACVWGTKEKPVGNWSPYVAGANKVDTGVTFVTIGWNPIYIEPDVAFRDVMPNWGVKIECEGGKCGGLPCYIDPNEHKVNEVSQKNPPGAGGANFCVVSVPSGAKANIVVFNKEGGSSEKVKVNSASSSSPSSSAAAKASPTPTKSVASSSKTKEAATTSSAKKSSKTDSPSSTKTKENKSPEPTGTKDNEDDKDSKDDSKGDSKEDSDEGSEDGSEEEGQYGEDESERGSSGDSNNSDGDDEDETAIHPDDGAELISIDDGDASSSDNTESSSSSSGGNPTASGSSSAPSDQPLSSGGSTSFAGATSMVIFSLFSALVILL